MPHNGYVLKIVQGSMDKAIFNYFYGNVKEIAIFKVHEPSHS